MMSQFDRENMDLIMSGGGDWFTAKLLRLCQKADAMNLERLRAGFPAEVRAYEAWAGQGLPDEEILRGGVEL